MKEFLIDKDVDIFIDTNEPILLFKSGEHKIYWMGIEEESVFRCNVYLIQDGDEFILIDPGSRLYFNELKRWVSKITDPKNIDTLIICHQDPDVAASMVDWLEINANIKIATTPRVNILLPYYGNNNYDFFDVTKDNYSFKNGNRLKFIEAPFLHSPGAFVTYDEVSKFLFSGDIFAAIDKDWNLVVKDFKAHKQNLDLFNLDYMACNIATKGFVRNIQNLEIDAILPQHGSIIPKEFVKDALEYLKDLKCGIDIIYADLINGY